MTKVRKTAYIALGANLSNPKDNFAMALRALQHAGVKVSQVASLWHSPAWPAGLGHPDYVNSIASVETEKSAEALLDLLHDIEEKAGRRRGVINAPRPLDLDIVDYGGEICGTRPILPHPRLMDRPFVLLPLLEIAPDWVHPIRGVSGLEALGMLPLNEVFSHFIIERDWWV